MVLESKHYICTYNLTIKFGEMLSDTVSLLNWI